MVIGFDCLCILPPSLPTDLAARRRHFNIFMDNLRIVCNISPWTRNVFDLWPKQVSYSHPFIGAAIYNLIFTNVSDICQRHIIDGPPDARTALITLRRHCAPLTPDHIERTRESFFTVKQGHQEVATSYLTRLRTITRDCYHAGIPITDTELIKRAVRGGSTHTFYAASCQRFDADIRRAEQNDEALPPFTELESHFLDIDESRGLTLPSQNQRNHNNHYAHSARSGPNLRPSYSQHFTPQARHRMNNIIRSYLPTQTSNNRSFPNRSTSTHQHRAFASSSPAAMHSRPSPSHSTSNGRPPFQNAHPRSHQPHRGPNRPSPRPAPSNSSHRPPSRNSTSTPLQRTSQTWSVTTADVSVTMLANALLAADQQIPATPQHDRHNIPQEPIMRMPCPTTRISIHQRAYWSTSPIPSYQPYHDQNFVTKPFSPQL